MPVAGRARRVGTVPVVARVRRVGVTPVGGRARGPAGRVRAPAGRVRRVGAAPVAGRARVPVERRPVVVKAVEALVVVATVRAAPALPAARAPVAGLVVGLVARRGAVAHLAARRATRPKGGTGRQGIAVIDDRARTGVARAPAGAGRVRTSVVTRPGDAGVIVPATGRRGDRTGMLLGAREGPAARPGATEHAAAQAHPVVPRLVVPRPAVRRRGHLARSPGSRANVGGPRDRDHVTRDGPTTRRRGRRTPSSTKT